MGDVVADPTLMRREIQPVITVDADGNYVGAGGGGGGDASAANQQTANDRLTSILATVGATNGLSVTTDEDGTLQQYLRGLIALIEAGIAVSALAPFPVTDNGSSITIDTAAGAITVGGSVALTSAPPTSHLTDHLGAAIMTDVIKNGLTSLPPKFYSETIVSPDTDEELVALVPTKKIRSLLLVAQCGSVASTLMFESSTTTRKHKITAGPYGGQIIVGNAWGMFETAAGESWTATATGSDWEVSGVYVEV